MQIVADFFAKRFVPHPVIAECESEFGHSWTDNIMISNTVTRGYRRHSPSPATETGQGRGKEVGCRNKINKLDFFIGVTGLRPCLSTAPLYSARTGGECWSGSRSWIMIGPWPSSLRAVDASDAGSCPV